MMLDWTPRRMRLLRRYLAAEMDMEEIKEAIVDERPPTKYCRAVRERMRAQIMAGMSRHEMAASMGLTLVALDTAIYRYRLRPEVIRTPRPTQPPPRPSAYSLAKFDPVIARACRAYEASRGAT